jgi:hypothetical protein
MLWRWREPYDRDAALAGAVVASSLRKRRDRGLVQAFSSIPITFAALLQPSQDDVD